MSEPRSGNTWDARKTEFAHPHPSPPSLLAQTLRQWTANAERAFRYLAVCSDETVVGEDAVVSTMSELPGTAGTTLYPRVVE
jgi:predicted helicase